MRGIKIGEKHSRLPIIQGGMGVGVSLHKLAGAVAKEGGIGIISTADIGFKEPDFSTAPEQANVRALKKEIALAREAAPYGIIGVNIMCAGKQYEQLVKTAADSGVDLIISGAGLPLDLPKYVTDSTVKLAPIVSSERAFSLICKRWIKNYNRVPDLVVVEGPKAGGHLGFSFDELENNNKSLEQIITEVLAVAKDVEGARRVKIPVIAAGGIYDSEDIERFLKLGAAGVQMATRFVVTDECDADLSFKQAYINAEESDIEIIHSPVGMPGRAIRNIFLRRVEKVRDKISHCTGCLKCCHINEARYCITDALVRSVKGDVDNGLIFCGSNVYRIHEMTTVKKLLNELFPPKKTAV